MLRINSKPTPSFSKKEDPNELKLRTLVKKNITDFIG